MIFGKTLIKVGSSHALIIPASTMKKMGYTADTVFDIDDDGDTLIIRARKKEPERLALPKIGRPVEIDDTVKSLMGVVSYSQEEIENDPILKSALGL